MIYRIIFEIFRRLLHENPKTRVKKIGVFKGNESRGIFIVLKKLNEIVTIKSTLKSLTYAKRKI